MTPRELVVWTLRYLQERTESLFADFGVDGAIARSRDIGRRLQKGEYDRWIRANRRATNSQFPRWEVSPIDALIRFCGVIVMYVDCAAEILAAFPESFAMPAREAFCAHADGLDAVYWFTNRASPSGLDATIAALDAKLQRTLHRGLTSGAAAKVGRDLLTIAPADLQSHEVYVGRTYSQVQRWLEDEANLSTVFERHSDARQLLALELFDVERLTRRLQDGPIWNSACEDGMRVAQAAREESAAIARQFEEVGEILDARDALIYGSTRLEAGFGFRSWPGMILAAMRQSSSIV